MWQRIQTIYLTISLVLISLISVFPILTIDSEGVLYTLNQTGLLNSETNLIEWSWSIPIYIFTIAIGLISLLTIFMFKNRKRQLKLGRISYFLHLGMIAFISLSISGVLAHFDSEVLPVYNYSYFAPICSIVFVFLANRAIKKDEALVKSLDRLR